MPSRLTQTLAIVSSIGLVGVVAAIDQLGREQVNTSVIYGVTLLPLLWSRSRVAVWGMAAFALALTFLIHYTDGSDMRSLFHRGLAAAAVLATAGILHLLISSFNRLERGHNVLVEQNERLERINQQLAGREEEVARQNEELLSQTEELERQGEELRVANDELAGREQMLEHLLALSRTLTSELSKGEVLDAICEALGFLMNTRTAAAAILERQGDSMVVVCSRGLGPEGPVTSRIPLDRSFGHLVLSRDQSGFLEDIALRPDLEIPQPKGAARMVAALSTPLRVRGRRIGCVEVYSPTRRAWTDAEVSLVESLAAQAAISIEATELFTEVDHERRRFMSVFRTLPIGVIVSDDDYTDVRANPAASAMLNLPVEINLAAPRTGRTWKLYHNARLLERDQIPLYRAARHGEEINSEEYELVLADGRRLDLLVGASPIRDRDGNVVGAVCAFADITAMKKLEQELDRRRREAEEAALRKTRFLAAVSHDIRTPANAINLLAELIRHSAANPAMNAEIPAMAGELRDSATALVNLVTDVLDLARYDTGRVELHETEFDLIDALREESRQVLPLAQSKGLHVCFDPVPRDLHVRTDRIKLGRVISNLLGNAIKFTNRGTITLDVSVDPSGSARIEISDTGVGIPPEDLPRIFDEFFQLRNPARDPIHGTGLGLTICKRLLDALGGELRVESDPGEGTRFEILLPPGAVLSGAGSSPAPVGDGSVYPADGPPSAGRRLEGMRLLLVEDHHTTRAATQRILHREGALVAEAPDGAAALRLLEEFNPHVILLDMMLPDMSGADVLRRVRRDGFAARRVLVMTGDVTPERMKEVEGLGADAFLSKPIDLEQLITHVGKAPIDGDKIDGQA